MNLSKYTTESIVVRKRQDIISERRKIVQIYLNNGYDAPEICDILSQAEAGKKNGDLRPYINPETKKPWAVDTIRNDIRVILSVVAEENLQNVQQQRSRLFSQRNEVQKRIWKDIARCENLVAPFINKGPQAWTEDQRELILKSIAQKVQLYGKLDTSIEKTARLLGLDSVQKNITPDDMTEVFKKCFKFWVNKWDEKMAFEVMSVVEMVLKGEDVTLFLTDNIQDANYEDIS